MDRRQECGAFVNKYVGGVKRGACEFSGRIVDARSNPRLPFCEDAVRAALQCPDFGEELERVKREALRRKGLVVNVEAALRAARNVDKVMFEEVTTREDLDHPIGVADGYALGHIKKYGVRPDYEQVSYEVGRMANLGVRVPEVRIEAPVVNGQRALEAAKPAKPARKPVRARRTASGGGGNNNGGGDNSFKLLNFPPR